MGNSFVYPSIKNARHVDRLEEYRKYTLSQILESYRYWVSSEYCHNISLPKNAFDDVFGQLFNDCDVHFDSFIYKGVTTCVALDVFYVLILLADDTMAKKLHLLFQLGKDQEVTYRVDLIQSTVYRVIASCQLLFNMPPISKEDVNHFIDVQLSQFIERNTLTTLDPALIFSRQNHEITHMSSVNNNNNELKNMSFADIYQWCQDVFQINHFIEAIEAIKFDKRGNKFRNFQSIRHNPAGKKVGNSKPGTATSTTTATTTRAKSPNINSSSSSTRANSPDRLMSPLSQPRRTTVRSNRRYSTMQESELVSHVSSTVNSGIFVRASHPLWSYSIQNVLVQYSDPLPPAQQSSQSQHNNTSNPATFTTNPSNSTHDKDPSNTYGPSFGPGFYNEFPEITSEDAVFTAFEHCILSNCQALPVYTREPVVATESGHSWLSPHLGHFKRPSAINTGSFGSTSGTASGSTSGIASGAAGGTPNAARSQRETMLTSAIATAVATTLNGHSCSPITIGYNGGAGYNHGSGGGGGGGGANNNKHKDKFELFGVIDKYLVLSWMVHCCPPSVLQQVKRDEELARIRKKQSEEFGLFQSISMKGGGKDNDNNDDDQITTILENIQKDSEMNQAHAGSSDDRSFSLASVAQPGLVQRQRDTNKSNVGGQHNQWQETGELIANSTIRRVLADNKYIHSHQLYTKNEIFTIDQYIYNAIYAFARGYAYVPVASYVNRPCKVTQILTASHMIRFILANATEILGKFKDSVCSTSTLLRQPVTISSKINFGSAMYKLSNYNLDSVLVVGEDKKIQALFTTKSVTDFWFTWCQQARKVDRSLCFEDLQRRYSNKQFRLYKSGENVSFSIFSSLLTPLIHCQSLLRDFNVVMFDKFIKAGNAGDLQSQNRHSRREGAGNGGSSGGQSANNNNNNMGTITEQEHRYSDTDTDSDSDSDCSDRDSGLDGNRRKGDNNSCDDDDEDGDGRRRKRSSTQRKSILRKTSDSGTARKKSGVPGSSPLLAKKKSLSGPSVGDPSATVPPAPAATTTAPSVTTTANVVPTAPKQSMRSAMPIRRNVTMSTAGVAAGPSPSTATTITTNSDPSVTVTSAESTVPPVAANVKKPRATLLATAGRGTQLINSHRLTKVNESGDSSGTNAMAAATDTTKSMSLTNSRVPSPNASVPSTAPGTAPGTANASVPTTPGPNDLITQSTTCNPNNNQQALFSPDVPQSSNTVRLITHRMTKQQIAQQRALALKKKEMQAESDAKKRKVRTLENWYRTMNLLTPGDTIQSALEIMVRTESLRAYIATSTGEALGVITFQDICKELVLQEARLKQIQMTNS